jgi:O-antigen/teichoic acid export membrane protein
MTAVREPSAAVDRFEVRRSARSGVVSLAGAMVNGACGFVLTTVIVRSFGAVGSGALFTAIGLVSIMGAVCCVGADTGLLWALPRRRLGASGDGGRLLLVALAPPLLFATVVAAGGVIAAGTIAPALLDRAGDDGPALLRLAFFGVPVMVAMTVSLAAVRAVRPIAAFVAVQYLLVPISRPLLVGGAVAAGGGVVLGFGGWLLPFAVAAVVALLLLAGPVGVGAGAALRPTRGDWRVFWGFALPRAASAAIDASSMWIGVLLTSALAGQAQAGVFAAVGRYAMAGLLIMQGLRVAVAPQLSRLLGARHRRAAGSVYRQTTLWIVLASWPGYLLLGVFGPAFLHLFGAQFRVGATALAVLAAAMMVNVGVGLVQTVLLMSGNSRGHLLATAVGLTLNVTSCVVLIPRYGALGAAIAWSIGIVVENLIAATVARRTLGEPLFTFALVRVAVGAGACTAIAAIVGVVVAGRGVAGLGVALAVLGTGCAASLASRRVRRAVGNVRTVLRARTPAQGEEATKPARGEES